MFLPFNIDITGLYFLSFLLHVFDKTVVSRIVSLHFHLLSLVKVAPVRILAEVALARSADAAYVALVEGELLILS